MSGMFNLLPPEMCQVCFHVHVGRTQCLEYDTAPGPNGEVIELGLCRCFTNADEEYVAGLYIVPCTRPDHRDQPKHSHTRHVDESS